MPNDSAAILWTAEECLAATGGDVYGIPWEVYGISIDSRTVKPGDLFVALKGPQFDGHDYVTEAMIKGASAALVSTLPSPMSPDMPILHVEDTMQALIDLAKASRARSYAKIVGVTGSVGKTGSKEALASILMDQGKTHATAGNLNNHIGVPLTLARMPRDCDYAVIEMGMNHPGEIAPLSLLTQPHVAVITTVEAVHLEHFDDVAGIAREKAAIFAGLVTDGVAVLPADNPHIDVLIDAAKSCNVQHIRQFGRQDNAYAVLQDLALLPDLSSVEASIGSANLLFKINMPGDHWAITGLAILTAAEALGADLMRAAHDLASVEPGRGRGQRSKIQMPGGVLVVIDDAYNASPVSMAASLENLGRLPVGKSDQGKVGRRIAVLGDMLELGKDEEQFHADLRKPIEAADIDMVYTAGPRMAALHRILPLSRRGAHCNEAKSLARKVLNTVRAGDIVLIKGSAGARMGQVVDCLLELQGEDPQDEDSSLAAASRKAERQHHAV